MTRVFLVILMAVLYQSELVMAGCYYYCKICNNGNESISDCGDTCSNSCTNNCGNHCQSYINCSRCLVDFKLVKVIFGYDYCNSYRCNTHCKCDALNNCYECVPGYYGNVCKQPCPSDCKDSVCDKSRGTCSYGCVDGKYGNQCSWFCSELCQDRQCDQGDGKCTSGCIAGYYLSSGRCYTCPENCIECESASICTRCNTGYYITEGNTCSLCPTRCSTCDSQTSCGSCTSPHYWGSFCQHRCTNCVPTCHKTNGCTTCETGFYRRKSNYVGGYKCIKCPDNCVSCIHDYYCHACQSGFWGTVCSHPCLPVCEACANGSACTSCKPQYFNKDNEYTCDCTYDLCAQSKNGKCTRCSSDKWFPKGNGCCPCSSDCKHNRCFTNGTCIMCDDKLYGLYCEKQCGKNCLDEHCARNGVCYSCKDGYFGIYCEGFCKDTISGCKNCFQQIGESLICNVCMPGYYLTENQCMPCSWQCESGSGVICNSTTGFCNFGCRSGWFGDKCDTDCRVTNCDVCVRDSPDKCDTCMDRYYILPNRTCTSCSKNCKSGTTCDGKNGLCTEGCEDTWTGEQCNQSCPSGCLKCNQLDMYNCSTCWIGMYGFSCDHTCSAGCKTDGNNTICDKSNGTCLYGCKKTRFGSLCNTKCNDNCLPVSNSSDRTCYEENGVCVNGCKKSYYGNKCEDICNKNCLKGSCHNNGSCSFGCIHGYTGSLCMEALQTEDTNSNAAAIGGGAGAGVVVIVIITIVVAIVVFRRNSSSKFDTRDESVGPQQNIRLEQTNPGAVYSNIEETREYEDASQVPGVSNLPYANAPVRMSDLPETEDPAVPMVISKTSTRPSSADYLQEEEIDEGEIVEEEETDQGGEMDNTYYNVGGKRVAVPKLAEYIKNKSEQDLFNDFGGYNRAKEYVASSGPFKKGYETTPDFWRMIWQERCETVVMLTKAVEINQPKCEMYWPEAGENSSYADIQISCLTEDLYADFAIRILTVTKGGVSFNIHHVHFTAWPDKSIPHDVTSMIEFIQKVRSIHKDKNTPILVHCSAGIGRTGTFIVLDMLTYEGEDRGSIDIFGSVASLRYQRCNMVQTPEQYVYLHHAVLHSLTFDCRSIPGDIFLQNYNKLIERNNGEMKIDIQFQQLQSISEAMTDYERAEKARNKSLANKNRKDADIPADDYRVKLQENRKPGSSDYINAVYLNSFRKQRKFIAAQSPLPSTVVDFLSLVWQEKCGFIVSMEDSDVQDKTVKVYWPADNQVVKHGVFKVSCNDSKTTAHYTTKNLSIIYHGPKGEETRDVNLFFLTNWPKGASVPKSSDSLLELVKTVDILNRKSGSEPPILIHCRTGAERSCLFCAVSGLIEKMEIEHELSVVNTLRQIKARRLKAFSTINAEMISLDQCIYSLKRYCSTLCIMKNNKEEYKFCYQAVISYLKRFENYSNFQLKETEA